MSNTEIIFLGTGDAYHTSGLAHQSIWIKAQYINFLVDAGATSLFRMRETGLDPGLLDYIFITHFHGDHIAALPFIILYLRTELSPPRFPVFVGPVGLKERCMALFEATYRGSELEKGIIFMELVPKIQKQISIARNFLIDVFPMEHNHPESIGYRFYIDNKVIAVSGDTAINQNLLHLFHDADAAIIECTTLKPEYPSHTSLAELIEYLPQITARRIIPVHTSAEILSVIEHLGHEKIFVVSDRQRVSV